MMHALKALTQLGASFALLAQLTACTFSDGNPWGRASFEVIAQAELPERDTDGWFVTPYDYRIRVNEVSLELHELALSGAGTSAGPSTFDPANPPPGYSNCHNGHCHADSGAIVEYEDIQAELNGGAGPSTSTVVEQRLAAPVTLIPSMDSATLGECSNLCALPAGEITEVALHVEAVYFSVDVEDLREGEEARLSGPITLRETLELDRVIRVPMAEEVGRGNAFHLSTEIELHLEEEFWERIRWDQLQGESLSQSALSSALKERFLSFFDVHVHTSRP